MPITEFHDRSNKPIYTGDIVQYRLSKLNSGPDIGVVIKTKHDVLICWLKDKEYFLGNSLVMRSNIEEYITIVDTRDREK